MSTKKINKMSIKKNKFSIGLLGDKATGKSNIINVFSGEKYNNIQTPTIGINSFDYNINIKGKNFCISIKEIPGIKTYQNMTFNKIKDSFAFLLVYSITNKNSFQECQNLYNKLQKIMKQKNSVIILLGNQIDDEKNREVSKEEGEIFAKRNNFIFYECSAKNNINISEPIHLLINDIINRNWEQFYNYSLNDISNPIIIYLIGDSLINEKYDFNEIIIEINKIYYLVYIKIIEFNLNSKSLNENSGFIFVYSINDKNSFEEIKKLIEKNRKIKERNLFRFNILLIGNINDKNTERKVEFEEGENLSKQYLLEFNEISNKNDFKNSLKILVNNIIFSSDKNHVSLKKTIDKEFGQITIYIPKAIKLTDNYESIGVINYKNKEKYEGYIINNKREKKGIMTYINKDKYEGNWLNDLKSGYGKMIYNNGNKYEGLWEKDKKNGKGILIYHNNEKYIGNFVNDLKEGNGIFYYLDGSYYKGNFKEDKKDGYGILKYINKDIYEGYWENDTKGGKGFMIYNEGKKILFANENIKKNQIKICKIYEGDWKDNKWNGNGKIYFEKYESFEGNFKDDIVERTGKFTYTNGDIYKGELFNFEKNGFGVMKYNNGDLYIGTWKNDLKDGIGRIEYNNQNIFQGLFKEDKKINGIFYSNKNDYYLYNNIENDEIFEIIFKRKKTKGIICKGNFINDELNGTAYYIKSNCYFYCGNFEKNKRNGIGRIIYNNGEEYFGEWKNDKKEGHGKMIYCNKNKYIGNWKDDKIFGYGDYQFNNGKKINGYDKCTNEEWNFKINNTYLNLVVKKELKRKNVNLKSKIR